MASLFAHAVVPAVLSRAFVLPDGYARRVAIAGAICGSIPDLDVVTYALEIRANEPLGHRGLFHSLPFALLVALVATAIVCRKLDKRSPAVRSIFVFLLASTAAHGLLDAVTQGEVGVALFAPFSDARLSSPVKLLAACPVGLTEYLGYFGLLSIANELLYAVIPVVLAVSIVRARREDAAETEPDPRRLAIASVVWLAVAITARTTMPETFAPTVPRVLEPVGTLDAGKLEEIPRDGLPEDTLLTRFDDLAAAGLFGRPLLPSSEPWSSSFFPSWYGGEAGRWTEGSVTLGIRTLTGFSPPSEVEAKGWVSAASAGDEAATRRLFTLAPTEKVDIVFGHYDFRATKQGLGHSHNGHPRYWSGRCNGVATASIYEREPYRVVEVVGTEGQKIKFHPNEIKSLLSVSYYTTKREVVIGDYCREVAFDSGKKCSMSPAVLLVAIANVIGRGKGTFLIDALPTIAKQYYAIASAELHVGSPRKADDVPRVPALEGKVDRVVDVRFELVLSSTTLAYARANVRGADPTRYQKVGVVPVKMAYRAEVALDRDGALVGGRWTGDPADGPDAIFMGLDGPKLEPNGTLEAATEIPWRFVRALADKSVEDGPSEPVLDLRVCADACR